MKGCENQGLFAGEVLARSEPYVWAPGDSQVIKTNFLEAKWGRLNRPMITMMKLKITMNLTTGAGAALRAAQLYQILSQFYAKDNEGERLDVTGAALRIIAAMERRNGPVYGDLAVNTANQIVTIWIEIPIEPWGRVPNAAEYRWNAASLRVGEIKYTFSSATLGAGVNQATINSATMRLYVWMVDERGDAVNHKTRLRYRSYAIGKSEDTYNLVGALRWGGVYVGDVGEKQAVMQILAAQDYTSDALMLNGEASDILAESDLERREPRLTAPSLAEDEDDPTKLGVFQPLWQGRPGHPMTELPMIDQWGVRTSATLTTGGASTLDTQWRPQMLAAYIEDRPEQGCGSVVPGVVKTRNGPRMLSTIPTEYQRKLAFDAPPGALSIVEKKDIG